MTISTPFPRAAVSVLVESLEESTQSWLYLLVKRGRPPSCGKWSLPGGKVEFGEPLLRAAFRELEEETHIQQCDVDRVCDAVLATDAITVSEASHYVISTVAVTVSETVRNRAKADDDAEALRWASLVEVEDLKRQGDLIGEIPRLIKLYEQFRNFAK